MPEPVLSSLTNSRSLVKFSYYDCLDLEKKTEFLRLSSFMNISRYICITTLDIIYL